MTTWSSALCCECGHLRTVSTKYTCRLDSNKTYDDGCDPRGWRVTGTLRCEVCKKSTCHARLRDDADPFFRDIAESRMTGCPGCGAPEGALCTDFMGRPLGGYCRARVVRR
jgi:hypothetical protein